MKTVEQQIIKTHKAAAELRNATDAQIKKALMALADAAEKNSAVIIKANKKDIAKQDANDPKIDRLLLNEERIKNISTAIRQIARLPNPSGKVLEKKNIAKWIGVAKIFRAIGCRWCYLRVKTKLFFRTN